MAQISSFSHLKWKKRGGLLRSWIENPQSGARDDKRNSAHTVVVGAAAHRSATAPSRPCAPDQSSSLTKWSELGLSGGSDGC